MLKKIRSTAILLLATFLLQLCAVAVEPIDIKAKSAILIDPSNGDVLYEKNSTAKAYPASITKLMTALLVIENADLSDSVTASESAFFDLSDAGSSVGIKKGETMTVDNLLICLMVASANEAANILAEHVSGSVEEFITLMNSRAAELGCKNTHFVNTHGLHDEDHYTCAFDITLIAREAQKHPRLVEIYQMQKATIPATNIGEERLFFSTNSMLSPYKERTYLYKYTTGIKTGHTTPAGLCLVSSAEKEDLSFISVVLGASTDPETKKKNHFVETTRLFKWGFDNFKRKSILDTSAPVAEVMLELAWDRDHMVVHPTDELNCIVPNTFDSSKLVLTPELPKFLDAPIEQGQIVGKLHVLYEDRELGTVDLAASDSVERSHILWVWRGIRNFFSSKAMKICFIVFIVLIVIYIFFAVANNKSRSRRRRRSSYRGRRRR